MEDSLPNFRGLRCLQRVVESGSLTAAARELNVTTGAVSRQLHALELELGIKLIERSGRGILPTEAGEKLAATLAGAFRQISDAVKEARGAGSDWSITLNSLPTIVIHWLVPKLGELHLRHPNLDLRLRTSGRSDRFDHTDIDTAISVGPVQKAGYISVPFLKRSFVPVCSPSTAEKLGWPDFDGLEKASFFYSEAQLRSWHGWFRFAGIEPIDIAANGVRFENSSLAYQAVRSGNGVALGQPIMLRDELELGVLVQLFDTVYVSDVQYHVAYQERNANRQALKSLVAWLIATGNDAGTS